MFIQTIHCFWISRLFIIFFTLYSSNLFKVLILLIKKKKELIEKSSFIEFLHTTVFNYTFSHTIRNPSSWLTSASPKFTPYHW